MSRLLVAVARWKAIQKQKTPKMVIRSESGYKVTVPFAPPSNSYESIGQERTKAARQGRRSVHRRSGTKNPRISMDFFLGDGDNQNSIYVPLARFIALANRRERVQLVYTRCDAGLYYITDFSYEILDRRAADHEPSRANVSITFEYDAAVPATKAKTKTTGSTTNKKTTTSSSKKKTTGTTVKSTSKSSTKTARTYKVVRGDTLYKIAVKFYKNGNLYRKIADFNRISNPNLIRVGQVLKIPAL